jgi:hypothetical protein
MLVDWLIFPLLLGALSLGWGSLVGRLTNGGVAGALLLPTGLAAIVVVAGFATLTDATAELASPVVAGGAVAGLALWLSGARRRPDPWAAVTAVAVFTVFAVPVVLSGEATFAGYIKLDDTATWLAMTDRIMEHGRSLDGLAPSTYELTLKNYLATGYPVGSFLPLGVGGELLTEDRAWLFQPYLAFLAATVGLCFYSLCANVVPSRAMRAALATIASQPALLFAYSLWGGVKEMAAAWILALLAALLAPLVLSRRGAADRVSALLPVAVACAAGLGVLSIGGVVWLAPALLVVVVVLWASRGMFVAVHRAAVFLAMSAALSVPTLVSAKVFLRGGETLRSDEELGNLVEPLSSLQFFGVWPSGDFRTDPTELGATRILILVLVLAAAGGLAWAWSRRAWGLLLYVWTATTGCLIVTMLGSPWVDGKALATASPAFVIAALIGAVALSRRGRRIEAFVLAAAIAGGVLWSNALAYREVNLAPRDRLGEVEQIGERIAGQGPTLMTDYEPYGARHFLRDADPEGASELRHRIVPLRSGQPLEKLGSADMDQFQTEGLLVYRTLVLRRSPAASRPPSPFELISSGRYYEVWQRPQVAARITERLPLGDRFQPAARPDCGEVRRLARTVGPNGQLAAVRRDRAIVIPLSRLAHPPDWQPNADDPAILFPDGAGTLHANARVVEPGRYGIWVGGAFRGEVEVTVDRDRVASLRHELSHAGQFVPLSNLRLEAGTHAVTLRYSEPVLRPGTSGAPFPLGPLVLARDTIDTPVTQLPAKRASELCGRQLDWVEALGNG